VSSASSVPEAAVAGTGGSSWNVDIPLLGDDMLVSVIKQILPVGVSQAKIFTAEDKAKLDATFLVPHRWDSHYAKKFGTIESFLASHPNIFGFTSQGAVYRMDSCGVDPSHAEAHGMDGTAAATTTRDQTQATLHHQHQHQHQQPRHGDSMYVAVTPMPTPPGSNATTPTTAKHNKHHANQEKGKRNRTRAKNKDRQQRKQAA